MTTPALPKTATLEALPPIWPTDLLPEIQGALQRDRRKVVVLDDDPTGTQTVHGVPVLTEWPVDLLAEELANDLPALYLLTNSRSVPPDQAEQLNRDIAGNLRRASERVGREFVLVSRSDSTLRGHFPLEVDALADVMDQRYRGLLLVPFFLEGGRYTLDDVHYVAENDLLLPAATTPFARDSAFGYTHSNLRAWVEEKSGGRIRAEQVASISVETLRSGGPDGVAADLARLDEDAVCVVNAAAYRDLEVFVAGLLKVEANGRPFLYRTAASFVRVRAGIEPRALLSKAEMIARGKDGGGRGALLVVGSYVPKTTAQVHHLLAQNLVAPVMVEVAALLDPAQRDDEISRVAWLVEETIARGEDVLVYTSRALITGRDGEESLAIGQEISRGLVEIVRGLETRPRYLLAKGGITSSDVATAGLGIRRAMVMGSILPGIPVWSPGAESRFPGMPYIVFPGNVGGDDAVASIVDKLRREE